MAKVTSLSQQEVLTLNNFLQSFKVLPPLPKCFLEMATRWVQKKNNLNLNQKHQANFHLLQQVNVATNTQLSG